MKKPLKHAVQNHLNSKQLSAQQLKSLQQLETADNRHNSLLLPLVKITGVACLVLLTLFGFSFFRQDYPTHISLEQRIAQEVATNHLKLKPLETKSQNMQGIKQYFKQLNFLPVEPEFLQQSRQILLGGRYCSIQGVSAAQLRLKNNKTGQIQSLYETQYDPHVFKNIPQLEHNEKPLTVYAKGVKVNIWVEKDILFALTESTINTE